MNPQEDPVKRAKIIDKIKKCLALSKSANEHEASAALRQAQKLMKAYDIDEMDVEGTVVVNEFVDCREKWSRTKPISLTSITQLMMVAFGVIPVWSCSPAGRHRITYWGQRASVTIAVHAHKMVYRAADQAWEKYKAMLVTHNNPLTKDMKPSFLLGWCEIVKSKVENLAPKGESYERMKRAAEAKMGMKPGQLQKSETRDPDIDYTAARAGVVAAKDFTLHIPITGSN